MCERKTALSEFCIAAQLSEVFPHASLRQETAGILSPNAWYHSTLVFLVRPHETPYCTFRALFETVSPCSSYDKGPGHLARNVMRIWTSILCPSELPNPNQSLYRLFYIFSPSTRPNLLQKPPAFRVPTKRLVRGGGWNLTPGASLRAQTTGNRVRYAVWQKF